MLHTLFQDRRPEHVNLLAAIVGLVTALLTLLTTIGLVIAHYL
jgi:hypothetical protein